MQSAYRIFRVFGISVELHITFILLLFGLFGWGWLTEGLLSGLRLVILFLLVFAIVVTHELTHSVVALLAGIKVSRITLLPIGGAAHIEIPEKPHIELVMSVAGPLLNIVLAVFTVIAILLLVPDPMASFSAWDASISAVSKAIFTLDGLLIFLLHINILLALFNLLPIFPMDGGRVFRAILALFMDYTKATGIAVSVGQNLSFLLIVIGVISTSLWFTVIGLLIFFAAGQELKVVKLKHALIGVSAGEAAIRNYVSVSDSLSLREFLDNVARPQIYFYPVVDSSGEVTGMFSLDFVRDIKSVSLDDALISKYVSRDFVTFDAGVSVSEEILSLMESDFAFVSEGGKIIGYLTPSYLAALARYKGVERGIEV